jgi:hypothetical protein
MKRDLKPSAVAAVVGVAAVGAAMAADVATVAVAADVAGMAAVADAVAIVATAGIAETDGSRKRLSITLSIGAALIPAGR